MAKISLSSAIKKLREQNGWSRETLTQKIGVSLASVYRWENDESKPSPMAMKKLKELGLSF